MGIVGIDTMRTNEQKLVDICFEIALTMKHNSAFFEKQTTDETADWVANQLKQCGFPTIPCGSSWGILTIKDNK